MLVHGYGGVGGGGLLTGCIFLFTGRSAQNWGGGGGGGGEKGTFTVDLSFSYYLTESHWSV